MADEEAINHFDCDGYRPLHHAILAHDLERARALLEQGAMINAPTESGDGALVLLCKALRDDEAVQWLSLLLDHGAEILDRDRLGWTALHHCAARGLEKTARALVNEGADPFFKSLKAERPIDVLGLYASSEGGAVSKEVWSKILSRPE